MTTFDDRRDAMERKFALDEEGRFRATARRNKLFGLWVAGEIGRTGPEADEYARSVVAADFEEPGDGDVLRKVTADLQAAGRPADDASLRRRLEEFAARAASEIASGQ